MPNATRPRLGAGLRSVILLSVLAFWPAVTPIVAGSETIGQHFDGPPVIWRLTGDGGRILASERLLGGGRAGSGCQRLIVAPSVAQSIMLVCPIAKHAVLDELEIRLWVKASRADIQLAARVTMPRSVNKDGRPSSAIVRGAVYDRPGQWQQLVLREVPRLLIDEVGMMRMAAGATIDPREGYVDSITLVLPREPHVVELFIGELEVDGVPLPAAHGVQLASFPTNATNARDQRPLIHRYAERDDESASRSSNDPTAVRIHGPIVIVEGKPFMPRAIEWQNEPFQFLAERGFNTIYLPSPPTDDQAAEAIRHSLWLVCSAPRPSDISHAGLGQANDRVIAWHLADQAVEVDAGYGRNWADLVQQLDAGRNRPLVMGPQADADATGDTSDIASACHPRAAWMPLADFDEWLESSLRRGLHGRPWWVTVPTQLGDQASRQSAALAGTLASPPSVDADQLSGLVEIACVHGCRGIVFGSRSRLDEDTPQARHRAACLELTNRRLQLVEPWIAGGKVIGRVISSDAAWTGMVLQVDYARLVMPIANPTAARDAQATIPAASTGNGQAQFVVPGVPETSQVFWLSPAAFRRIQTKRIAGGTRIEFPTEQNGMLLITEDPQVIQSFRQRIAHGGPQMVKLERELAEQRVTTIEDAKRNLAHIGSGNGPAAADNQSWMAQLRQSHSLLSAGRIEAAYNAAAAANRMLLRAAAVQQARLRSPTTLTVNPLALSCDQRLDYGAFLRSCATLRASENRLYGGDFEDLGQMSEFGWAHVSREMPGTVSSAKLSAAGPKHGRYCLELSAGRSSPAASDFVGLGATVWIESPPMSMVEGQMVEITGWVRIDRAIADSVDGLQIVDSLGGPELTLAVRETSGWQPFQLIRGVPESTELRLMFALSGFGTACVDGVMVRTLEPPSVRRLPPVQRADRSAERTKIEKADSTTQLLVVPGGR
jgi:hypothetical protein